MEIRHRAYRSFLVGQHLGALGEGTALGPWGGGAGGGSMGALHSGLSQHFPYMSFHLAVPELHP